MKLWDRVTWRLWGRLAREEFSPGWLGIFTNPFFLARRALYENMREFGGRLQGRVLDIGCGSKPYQNLISATSYVGLEYDTPASRQRGVADAFYREDGFPFESASFDGVLCTEVLEHVFDPERFLKETARVLKPSGLLLLTTPFVWDEHEQPCDFARYTSFGLRHVIERAGFVVLEQRRTLPDARVIAQLVNACVFKKTRTRSRTVNLMLAMLLTAPVTVLGLLCRWILPGSHDLYLDNVILARKRSSE